MAVAASAVAIAGLGMGVLGACSSDSSSSSSSSQVTENPNANNQQDAVFANQTIALNEQIVVVTDVLSVKADDAAAVRFEELGRIAQERSALAQGWLVSWGRATSEAPDPPGLLSTRQITAITVASGSKLATEVKKAAAQLSAATIAMSDAELAGGVNPDAREFAQTVKDSAESELAVLTGAST